MNDKSFKYEIYYSALGWIVGLLAYKVDEYIITEGGLKGHVGFFTRNENDYIIGVDLAGRLFNQLVPGTQEPQDYI